MSVWEQTEDSEVPRIRLRLPAMSERIWNPDWPADSSARASEKAFKGFMARLQPLDAKAGLLMTPIRLQFDGLTDPSASGYHNKENWHNRPLTITMAPSVPGAQVRYTTNGAAPDLQSPACAGPITLAEPKTVLRARAFDSAGAPLGQTLWETYEYRPIEARVTANGLFKADDERDHDGFERGAAVTVALSAPAQRGGAIRTALSGPVTEESPSYSGPILITNDTDFSAGYFDAAGKLVGQAYRRKFEVFKNFERSLTTDKPATSSKGAADPENPGVVCDGFVFDRGFWSGGPCPDWWQVDLGRVHTLDKIQVVTYWDGGRYYQYYVEVSRDGRLWKKVIDRTRSTEKATDKGYTETFAPTPGRYIRVTVTRNSANPGVHMVEVRAWEAKRP
jgi:hypothetical protein